ncbi:glycosyltransferase family 4 protein [Empedobacter falsenii]|uniref:Lipopolysaccharide 1,2-N-acetylglucosaminetransferase n=1 Tax=Empedobacter falsenii TaxID=343874 RepID=A0A376G429_9FLAO|nr:glycosyltransferase family 4 protein [Empedobacter falsenii]STD53406.1 lipopolysaccharide 1,2-N-acetylglucosaminetransferase [Empedobacter falsenii]
MKISILFLGKIGAGPRYSFEMAKALSERKDIELQIILSEYVDNRNDWEILGMKNNVKLQFFKTYITKLEFLFTLFNIFKYRKIAQTIKIYNPDALYIPMISLINPGILFFIKSIKIYYTLHDPIEHVGEKNSFVELIRKYELKKSDKVILLNNFFRGYVQDHYKIHSNNIIVIPHASFFSNTFPSLNSEFKKKFLFVGRIEEYKGIGLLLEALSQIIETKKDIVLTIAGRGDLSKFKNQISALSNNLLIDNRWLTNEEIDSLIQENDFVVLPYLDASQSGVVPVVFANKRFVIVTNKGALSEQVPEGMGYVVNADAKSLAEKILKIYNLDFKEVTKINNNAYDYAFENLTWDASAKILMNSINKDK